MSQLRSLIRGVIQEAKKAKRGKKIDQDGDGKSTFKDVQIARRIASGMSHEDAVKDVNASKD